MRRVFVKQLAKGLVLVLLALLAACSQPQSSAEDTDIAQSARPPKDQDHAIAGIINGVPGLPDVPIPAPLEVKEGALPVTDGISSQAVGSQVQLKFLLIGVNSSDFGLDTWKAALGRVGAPYDVLLAQNTPLTADMLADANGVGKYNAVLLTNNSLLYQDPTAGFISAFDSSEWNTLWAYERTYKVRQVSLYTSYGTFPEDYCLRAGTEGGVGSTPINASLNTTGNRMMPELKSGVQIPISLSYVYRPTLASGCSATAFLTNGTTPLGVLSTSSDGRERAALTFSSNVNLIQSTLLTYSLLRWASKGVYLGEYRHYLNVDVDDWFNYGDERNPDGTYVPGGYRNTPRDVFNTVNTQLSFTLKYLQVLPSFQLNLAYNGEGANLTARPACLLAIANIQPDPLTSATLCVHPLFNWINHSLTHLTMNDPNVATLAAVNTEISQNLAVASTLRINVSDKTVLKTGEYSGLGVYNPNPNDNLNPPTDFGLMASNPNLLLAAKNNNIKYLHGNMSFKSHQPSCFNCSTYHPLNSQLGTDLWLVPDWPTNLAYLATLPAEEVSIYNCFFGPNGTCAGGAFRYWPQDLTYPQIIEAESDIAFQQHLATGSVYTHTLHTGNLRQYSTGKNLAFDWLDRIVAKYATYYDARILNPSWTQLAGYSVNRSSHFSSLSSGAKAIWDRSTNQVSISSPAAGTVYITGIDATNRSSYSGNTTSRINLGAGQTQNYSISAYVRDGLTYSPLDTTPTY